MDQWSQMSGRFHEWHSPLRPSSEDVSLFKKQLSRSKNVLLLGVTEELRPLANIAIDNNPAMIAKCTQQGILGDWGAIPFTAEFDALIGDGCLTVFQGPAEIFFEQTFKALKKGGKLVLRLFVSPEKKENLDAVLETKSVSNFHAFKWRVAQALASPYVAVQEIRRTLLPLHNHPTLEVYRDSDLVYYFPKLSELPTPDHVDYPSSYELSDRCPIVTWYKD